MNTGNNITNNLGTNSEEKYPFEELAKFIAKRTSQNEGLQQWMVTNSCQQGVVDVTALTRLAQSASIHVNDNLDLVFSFTDKDNKVHKHNLTEKQTSMLQTILSNNMLTDEERQHKLSHFFDIVSASVLAKQNYNNIMSQDNGVVNNLHR